MHIILGGTGQVGSAAARALLARGEAVTVVTRHEARGAALRTAGARVAVADVRAPEALRRIFQTGRRALILNPPAPPASDTDAEERATIASIIDALEGSGLEKVVAQSTYGARPGDHCGDLTTLYELEERLRDQAIPAAITRGAYYMSNWDGAMDIVRATGRLPSFLPPDVPLPMVAPADLGDMAARRLLSPPSDVGLLHMEGPESYSPQDVATAFAEVLGRPVTVAPIPREAWLAAFREMGFSPAAARSYVRMTGVVVDGGIESPPCPERGGTTLARYIRDLTPHYAR